jgi:hypothetical protein
MQSYPVPNNMLPNDVEKSQRKRELKIQEQVESKEEIQIHQSTDRNQ